jgi:hypothetical protein
VKKLMPSGSTRSRWLTGIPNRVAKLSAKKLAYLNTPRTARFATTAAVMMAPFRVAANAVAARQFARIEPMSRRRNHGFQ